MSLKDLLSKAETLVVNEAIKGGSRKDIGKKLHISWMTVRSHLWTSYKKLGVKNRVQLALKVAELTKAKDGAA